MPILYPSTETEFNSNGIGVLSDAVSCLVKQELNGLFELTMQYPVNGIHFAQITQRAIILAKADPVSALQPFRVYKLLKTSPGIITVYARHLVYDLAGVPVAPFTATTAPLALEGLKNNAVVACPFAFSTDKTTEGNFTVTAPLAAWSLFGGRAGSILDVYGGEYEYDRFNVHLWSRRGADRGVSIRYGKNLTSLQQDENCANCYTGVMPYWINPATGAVKMLPEQKLAAEGTFDYVKILPLDLTQTFTSQATSSDEAFTEPTDEQLRTAAIRYMKDNKIGEPDVSWTVQFVQLEQTEEYKGKALLERVLLGDTVSVEFPALGISTASRAVGYTYNAIMERYESITLGSVKANIADTIVGQGQQIATLPDKSQLLFAMDQLANAILGATGGAVRLLDTDGDKMPDTLYIADNTDPALAVKVWRFNYEGWAASQKGYNGPFEMGATFDTGILADFIKAGTLDASIVKVINLIAEVVLSVNAAGDYVTVKDGEIVAGNVSDETMEYFALRRISDESNIFQLVFNNINSDGEPVSGIMRWDALSLGSVHSTDPAFRVTAYRDRHTEPGYVKMLLPADDIQSRELYTYWHDNGDGTFSMQGTLNWQS